ncbi:MAG: MBL fold metallo-hydrolase [Chloroflexi bacterium]|nr:MBL fold metallo-hydrolase [Chloroflexota bacterium]MCH7952855.1 MBL fold metallo-hydrolase [Chloroflexota bacterium]MCI0783975.1 MBL fold metallo-hydrolase [Chloroflexota bacterium]MCI0813966.1 MBL fold metallo-hydrolase [Chloroflexota bacterium]MCI0817251.1 MBL fold metallo-hydrolase [Chloroflexota bacterium]
MEIVWLGHSSFRIRAREATVITDPCPPSTGYDIGKPTADVVSLSHAHDDHTYLKAVAGKPIVVDGPGEYEISGAFLTAIPTYHDGEKGGERGKNLVFVIEMEGIKICHLGDLGHVPTADQAEGMTGADVLMIPVGGDSTIDGAKAAEIVPTLDARIVIPMHYKTPVSKGDLESADRFLKEMQATAVQAQPKLSLSYNTVPSDTQVILLDYRGKNG